MQGMSSSMNVLKEWSMPSAAKLEDMALRDVLNRRLMSRKWREQDAATRQKLQEINKALDRVLKAPLAPIDTQTVVKFVGEKVVMYYPLPTQQVVLQLENDSVAIEVAESVLADE
jgi:hypothetical protein